MTTRLLVSPPLGEHTEARRQWDRFTELATCVADVDLVVIEPHAQTPHLTFTANAALVCGNLAIVASFRHAERRREQPLLRAALASAHFATTYLRQTYFEGAGDALFDRVRPLLYAGYGPRTERSATLQLQEIVNCRVLPLMLVDDAFSHLDAVLCPLATGHVLVHLEAFSPHAQQLLRRAVEPELLVPVTRDDALHGACNALEIGDALVIDDCSPRLRDRLRFLGYRVIRTELGELRAAGGSAKALALRLEDGPAEGKAAATA